MNDIKSIRDLIYFDVNKAASIWSQIQGGLLEKISISEETSTEGKGGASIGIPSLLKVDLGISEGSKGSILRTKIIHHDLLNKLESELRSLDLIIDINRSVKQDEINPDVIRGVMDSRSYVVVEGWAVFEDYRKILNISKKFNKIIEFIEKCAMQKVSQSPEYLQIKNQISVAKKELSSVKDRNIKTKKKLEIQAFEKKLNETTKPSLDGVEDWLLKGIEEWIDTYMPNRINLRIYPFIKCPSFQVLCNLKSDCFVDQDLEHLLYGYGYRPNIPLTAIGLITSIPPKTDLLFDPLSEFSDENNLDEKVRFEEAFRKMFSAMDEIESYMRYSRYPNITIHPIAVFRNIEIKK